SGVV
ncbi:hypothetical protein D047_0636B, partial [Vibrio parahaemolyticus VPTS-2010_2]